MVTGACVVTTCASVSKAAPLRHLAARRARGPLVTALIAEPEPHLPELHQAAVRLLLDLRGIEGIERLAVGTGLHQPGLHGRVTRIVQRLTGAGTRHGLRLRRGQQHQPDDEREQREQRSETVDHRARALRALSASR